MLVFNLFTSPKQTKQKSTLSDVKYSAQKQWISKDVSKIKKRNVWNENVFIQLMSDDVYKLD